MNTKSLKKELHVAIDSATDTEILNAVYTILRKSEGEGYELSDKEKKELDQLSKLHKAGKSKSYSMAEVRKYAQAKLKK